MLPIPAIGRRSRDLPQQQSGEEFCGTNNRECDILYLYRHSADTSTSGNHQDLPHPLPSRPLMHPAPATARRPSDLPVQQDGGESCHTNNRECDMLHLYRHRARIYTTGNHRDLPDPLPSRQLMLPAPAIARRPSDLPLQLQGGETSHPKIRECDMSCVYRHRADISTTDYHQDLPYPLLSRLLMRPSPGIARCPSDLPR